MLGLRRSGLIAGVIATPVVILALTGCSLLSKPRDPGPVEADRIALQTPWAEVATSTVSPATSASGVKSYLVFVRTPAGGIDPRDPFRMLFAASEQHADGDVTVVFRSAAALDTMPSKLYYLTWRKSGALEVASGDDQCVADPSNTQGIPTKFVPRNPAIEVGDLGIEQVTRIAQGVDSVPERVAAYWEY